MYIYTVLITTVRFALLNIKQELIVLSTLTYIRVKYVVMIQTIFKKNSFIAIFMKCSGFCLACVIFV